jgi:hypothetical protein
MKIGAAFPSSYLKASDLQGKAVRVTIDSVSTETLGDDRKAVLHFVGKEKGLVLNKTNANRIVEATGSDETDDWEGWSITLYATKVDYQGKRVDAIRVDDRPGSSKAPARKATPPPREPGEDDVPEDVPELSADDIGF